VPIRSGDRIRTGPDGFVQLRFADGALISLQPGSDFRVDAWIYDAQHHRSFFELLQGSIRAVSGRIGKRNPEDWRLRTPAATIGIRGTAFSVHEAPICPVVGCPAGIEPGLTVEVTEGRGAVGNAAGAIEVPAGSTLRLRDARTVPTLAAVPCRAVPDRAGPRRRACREAAASAPSAAARAPPAAMRPARARRAACLDRAGHRWRPRGHDLLRSPLTPRQGADPGAGTGVAPTLQSGRPSIRPPALRAAGSTVGLKSSCPASR
jgi:hypothetical protein